MKLSFPALSLAIDQTFTSNGLGDGVLVGGGDAGVAVGGTNVGVAVGGTVVGVAVGGTEVGVAVGASISRKKALPPDPTPA